MIILIDVDGPLVDFEGGIHSALKQKLRRKDHRHIIPVQERTTFRLRDQYPLKYHSLLMEIMCSEGFYGSLQVKPDAIVAIFDMKASGLSPFFCTAPLVESPFCPSEKFASIKEAMGEAFLQRTIITYDKTMIHGDYLIDDRPDIEGVSVPSWRQILFSLPHNAAAIGFQRLDCWEDWRKALLPTSLGFRSLDPLSI